MPFFAAIEKGLFTKAGLDVEPLKFASARQVMEACWPVALMERRGFSADQYRDLHPGGALGRALVRVSDIMHTGDDVPLVAETTPMREVLIEMAARRFGCVGVLDAKGALAGIITDGDLRRTLQKGVDLHATPIASVMTRRA